MCSTTLHWQRVFQGSTYAPGLGVRPVIDIPIRSAGPSKSECIVALSKVHHGFRPPLCVMPEVALVVVAKFFD
jgi:hypothetical protein